MAPTKMRSTSAQLRYMIDFMSENPEMATEEFAGTPFNSQKRQAKWARLKHALKEYGPDKSIIQWKTTWRDLKRSAKNEQKKVLELTAKGEALKLSQQSSSIMDILHKSGNISANTFDDTCDNDDLEFEPLDTAAIDTEWNEKRSWVKKQDYKEYADSRPSNTDEVSNQRLKEDPLVYEYEEEDEDTSERVVAYTLPQYSDPESEIPKKKARHSRRSSSVTSNPKQNRREEDNSPSEINVINTLNKFIEYEREKERLAHEREMSKAVQNQKMLNLFGRIVNVIEDLAPSIKKCLNRDVNED